MKTWIMSLTIGVLAATLALDADAQRRLGGARNIGKQSPQVQKQAAPPAQQPAQAAPAQPGAQQAAPTKSPAAASPAATVRPASPWRGALMGLAAGLGIAALASWLGMGETLSMILTVMLIGLVLMVVVGFILRRMRGPQAAYAGAARRAEPGPGTYSNVGYETAPAPLQRAVVDVSGAARPGSAMDQFSRASTSAGPWGVPADFDAAGFLAKAKQNYIRLQKAWDRADLDEMSDFTTNDLFVTLTHDLRARGGRTSTEVVELDASLLGVESGPVEHVASVKFTGSLRIDGEIENVSEVWNLSKPVNGRSGWVLAGIQQIA